MNSKPIDANGQVIEPYTLKELETMYGKMGALVVWQMRQQDWTKPVR